MLESNGAIHQTLAMYGQAAASTSSRIVAGGVRDLKSLNDGAVL